MLAARSLMIAPASTMTVTPLGISNLDPSESGRLMLSKPMLYERLSPIVARSLSVPPLPTMRTTLPGEAAASASEMVR